MLRSKGLTDKLMILGIDGMDPRFTKRLLDEGKLPNVQKLVDAGSCREDLMLLGANPTITPPLWATLATGCYPMTHGITDYNISGNPDKEIALGAFSSRFLKAEPIFNVTAEAGIKTLVFHWPGGSFPPSIDSENLYTVDGSSPGACCGWASRCDDDTAIIASTLTKEPVYKIMSTPVTDLKGDEELQAFAWLKGDPDLKKCSKEMQEKVKKYQKEYQELINVPGYNVDSSYISYDVRTDLDENVQWKVEDWCISCSMSPISEPSGWNFAIPADSKEFVIKLLYGAIERPALILRNNDGKYDRVAVYKDKKTPKEIVVLEKDVFTGHVYDTIPTATGGEEKVTRNMRLLEIADDGTYVRMWASTGMRCNDDSIFFPKTLHKELTDKFGPPVPTSQMSGNDEDLIMKCNNEQWRMAAKWQSDCIHYMIEEKGVKAIFSHYHNVDLQTHNYVKYLKNRDTSRYDESKVVEFAEATYKTTDEYLGTFLHYLDEGWTIILCSDHGLNCCDEDGSYIMGDCGYVNAEPLRKLGYTVLKRDADGNEMREIDWSKTTAYQTRSNSIYINLKGRDPHGIVEPEDKYELEEKIITDLYSVRDPKTNHRIVSLALHNKDAVLLGLGGPLCADIICFVHDDFACGHGNGLSTAQGYNDTSLSPIFIAAGCGIKQGFITDRWIREVDVAPTVAVLLGVDIPQKCEGAPVYQIFSENV